MSCLFITELCLLCVMDTSPLADTLIYKHFLLICGLSFHFLKGIFFFFLIFIHERHTERSRDIGRGRSRLPVGRLMWDSLPGSWDHDQSQRQSLNHWTTQALPFFFFLIIYWGTTVFNFDKVHLINFIPKDHIFPIIFKNCLDNQGVSHWLRRLSVWLNLGLGQDLRVVGALHQVLCSVGMLLKILSFCPSPCSLTLHL